MKTSHYNPNFIQELKGKLLLVVWIQKYWCTSYHLSSRMDWDEKKCPIKNHV